MLHLLLPLVALAQPNVPSDISSVYSYQCNATFIEGEGVTPYSISCPAFQSFGLITAQYTHYLFSSARENNFSEKGAEEEYSQLLCGRFTMRVSCTASAPKLRFGLSRRPEGVFGTNVILTSSYRGVSRSFGYAALPGVNGACPAGLVRARVFEARPESIQHPLPTSFGNERGNLNDAEIFVDGDSNEEFSVFRWASAQPCDGMGNCRDAIVSGPELAQSAPYIPSSPAFCVVPKESLELK